MRLIAILSFALMISAQVFSQKLNRHNVKSIYLRDTGPILLDHKVNGYYFFCNVEKADRKNNVYEIVITDEDLNEKKTLEITKSNKTQLIEARYNENAFLFMFYDYGTKAITLETYDNQLKALGAVTNKVTGSLSISFFSSLAAGQAQSHSFISNAGTDGFVYYGFEESKRHKYAIHLYDNKLNLKWSAHSSDQTKQLEFAEAGFQSSKYIGTLIAKRKSNTAKEVKYELLVHDREKGKELFIKDLSNIDEQYNLAVGNVTFDAEKELMYLFGEYFNAGDKQANSFALGYFYFSLDMKGKVVKKRYVSWEDDISRLMPLDKRGKMEKGASLYVHEIVRMDNGDIYVIGEQFKKMASGAGIAMAALYGSKSNTATVQIQVLDLVVFKFDNEFNLKKADIYSKGRNTVLLPSGSEWLTSKMLAVYVKSKDGFDFSFAQTTSDNNGLTICYIDYEKEKGEKARNVVNSVSYGASSKEPAHSKADISRKSTTYGIYKGKDHHIMVAEYFKKTKSLDLRLEKIQ